MRLPHKEEVKLNDFKFCAKCNGLYRKGKNLNQHVRTFCSQREENPEQNEAALKLSRSSTILAIPSTVSKDVTRVVSVMRDDPVTRQVRRDELILYVAHIYMGRIKAIDSHEHIRQRMRLLAKVVICMNKPTLKDALLPEEFNTLCEAVKNNFRPSSQIKLGIYLKNGMDLLYNLAIQNKKDTLRKTMKQSQHLLVTEWKHRIGHQALLQSEQRKFNKVDILPISRDVLLIREHLDSETTKCVAEYLTGQGCALKAKKLLACKITVFNKRRGMEFIKSTKDEIKEAIAIRGDRPLHQVTELHENLSPIEKELSRKMKLLCVKGKQGKGVPVLFEPTDWKLLNCLLDDPACKNEKFLFQNKKERPLRGHDMLGNLARSLPLEKPDAIR